MPTLPEHSSTFLQSLDSFWGGILYRINRYKVGNRERTISVAFWKLVDSYLLLNLVKSAPELPSADRNDCFEFLRRNGQDLKPMGRNNSSELMLI